MAEAFDPYHEWLGILPKDQPPNHYRLLGVEVFEQNSATIANAADKQMVHLRSFQTGVHSAISQRLLIELAAARLCLLHAQKKAAYDTELHERFARQSRDEIPSTLIKELGAAGEAGGLEAARPLSNAEHKASIVPWFVAGGVAFVIVVVAAVVWENDQALMMNGQRQADNQLAAASDVLSSSLGASVASTGLPPDSRRRPDDIALLRSRFPSARRLVTNGMKPSWAPDGGKIAFAAFNRDGGIGIANLETATIVNLVAPGKEPAWSPVQGGPIAFVRGADAEREEIWVVDTSGRNLRKIADGGWPVWAKDGKSLYFHSRNEWKIFQVQLDRPGHAVAISEMYAGYYPPISADGKRTAHHDGEDLLVLDVEACRPLFKRRLGSWFGFLGSWSPDGKVLGCGSYGNENVVGLWLIKGETGQSLQVADGPYTAPAWSPDASRLAFDRRANEGNEIWAIETRELDKLWQASAGQDNVLVRSFNERSTAEWCARQARHFISRKRFDTAIACCMRALALDATLDDAYVARASAFNDNREYHKAIQDTSEAIRRNPKNHAAYQERAASFNNLGRCDDSIADCTKAIALGSRDSVTYYVRAGAYNRKGEYSKAVADATEAVRLNPRNARAYQERAVSYNNLERYADAIADCDKSLSLAPDLAHTYLLRAIAYSSAEQFEAAIQDASAALRLDPGKAQAYLERALSYSKLKRYGDALRDYKQSAVLNPNSIGVQRGLAWLLATCPDKRFRDGKQAVEHATRACELAELDDFRCLTTLAAAHAEAGSFDKAVRFQTSALKLAPDVHKAKMRERLQLYERRRPD